jgi:ABC-2 type transport system permease protein
MPMLFLSELFMPISLLPAWLQPAARALPLTALNTLLRDILYGVPVENLWRLGVLAGWLLFSLFLTVRFFKWEG